MGYYRPEPSNPVPACGRSIRDTAHTHCANQSPFYQCQCSMRSWQQCRPNMFLHHLQQPERPLFEQPDRCPETRRAPRRIRWALPKRVAGFEFETKFLRRCRDQFPELSISPDSISPVAASACIACVCAIDSRFDMPAPCPRKKSPQTV